MKSEEEKFDQLVRNKLEGLEVAPPASVWSGIQKGLANQRRGRVFFFYRVASAAAVVFLALIAYWMFTGKPDEQHVAQQFIQPEQTREEVTPENILNIQENKPETKSPVISLARAEIHPAAKPEMNFDAEIQPTRDNHEMVLLVSLRGLINTGKISSTPVLRKVQKISVTDLSDSEQKMIAMNVENLKNEKPKENAWEVGFRISPGYSSQKVSHSDSYRQAMTHTNADGNSDLNGGIAVNYKTGKRWKVESGVYYSRNGQTSGNSVHSAAYSQADFATGAEYFNTPVVIKQGLISMNSTAGVINFAKNPANIELLASIDTRALSSNTLLTPGEFQQVFDFIEIPVYVRYSVIESKVDVDLVGGLSANLLAGNNVYMETAGKRENVGKTSEVADLSYSGALGLGIKYDLGKNLSLSVEPRFNYYLNSLNKNEAVDYHPYRVGIFTGLNYQF